MSQLLIKQFDSKQKNAFR